jgi:hypothetical protein
VNLVPALLGHAPALVAAAGTRAMTAAAERKRAHAGGSP